MKESKDIQLLKYLKVLLIGDSCIDRYHYGTCDRISPEAPVPIFKVMETEKRGGMARNVKSNLEGLGLSVDLITNEKEIVKARYIDNKTRQHLIRIDLGEEFRIKPLSEKVLEKVDFAQYDCILISDYDKGFIRSTVIRSILAKCGERTVFVDSKKKDLSCYEGCILKINEKENESVLKFPVKYDLVVTLGEKGVKYKNKIYPTQKVEIFDICGAGDTFLASMAAAFALTQNMERAIIFANICSSFVVRKFGNLCH